MVFLFNNNFFFKIFQVSRGEGRKRWGKERVAPAFAVQGGSTSNDKSDCNTQYQCKMGGDFIEGDINGRDFLCGRGISLQGRDVAP